MASGASTTTLMILRKVLVITIRRRKPSESEGPPRLPLAKNGRQSHWLDGAGPYRASCHGPWGGPSAVSHNQDDAALAMVSISGALSPSRLRRSRISLPVLKNGTD